MVFVPFQGIHFFNAMIDKDMSVEELGFRPFSGNSFL